MFQNLKSLSNFFDTQILNFWALPRFSRIESSRRSTPKNLWLTDCQYYSVNTIHWIEFSEWVPQNTFCVMEDIRSAGYCGEVLVRMGIHKEKNPLRESAAESYSLSLRDKCHATSMMLPFHLVVLAKVLIRAKSRFDLEKTRSTRSLL